VDAVRDVFGSDGARSGLRSLPAPGRLLVSSSGGVWVVRQDGSKRRLGDYDGAAWSPAGKFVVATDERHVVALEPDTGQVRWSLTRPAVAEARWMPVSGTRVAYRSGTTLRVVDGDGTDDRILVRGAAPVPPAWQAAREDRLAYVGRRGVVRVVDAGTGRVLWGRRVARVAALAWSSDGARLAVVGPGRVTVLSASGRRLAAIELPPGGRVAAAAYSPRGRALAVLRRGADASEVVLLRARGVAVLSRSPGRLTGLAWSPDGSFVLVGWESADEWLFLPVAGGRPRAVGEITAEFAPGGDAPAGYPQIEGWVSSP
jgi:outer membrane protein assembly factor BamB